MSQAAKMPYQYAPDVFIGKVTPEWQHQGVWLSKAAKAFADPMTATELIETAAAFTELRLGQTPEAFEIELPPPGKDRDAKLLIKLETNEERKAWQKHQGALSAARLNLDSRLQSGSLLAFGDPGRPGADPEWIPTRCWMDLDPNPDKKDAVRGDAGAYWYVRVVDPTAEKLLPHEEIADGEPDSTLIRQCSELTSLLGALGSTSQGAGAAWYKLAAEIIRTLATTEDGIVAKYNAVKGFPDPAASPEMKQVVEMLERSIDRDLRRAEKDWRWLRLPPHKRKHMRIWECWQRNQLRDHGWIRLEQLLDFSWRFPPKHQTGNARFDAWHFIHDAILENRFTENGKSRVFFVWPGEFCWRISPERLKRISELSREGKCQNIEEVSNNHLVLCWVPYEIAARWLSRFGVKLSDYFPDPVFPEPSPATSSPPPGYLFIDQAVTQVRTKLPDLTARRASDRLLQAFRDGEFETHKKADNHLNTSRGRTRKLRWSSWDTAAIDLEEFIEQGHGGVLFEGKHWHLREFLIEGDGFVQWLNKIAPIATAADSASEVASSNILSAGNTIRQPTFLKNKPGPAPELRTKIANQMLSDYAAEPEKLAAEKQESLKTRYKASVETVSKARKAALEQLLPNTDRSPITD